jgi:hypothetical protein
MRHNATSLQEQSFEASLVWRRAVVADNTIVDGHAREHIVGRVQQRHPALGAAVGDFRPRGAARLECLFVLEDWNHPMTLAEGDELSASSPSSNVSAPIYLSYKTNIKATLQKFYLVRVHSLLARS